MKDFASASRPLFPPHVRCVIKPGSGSGAIFYQPKLFGSREHRGESWNSRRNAVDAGTEGAAWFPART